MLKQSEGETFFTSDEEREVLDAIKELTLSDPTVQLYKSDYFVAEQFDSDLAKIVAAAKAITHSEWISMRSIGAAFNLLIKAGQIQPKEITQVTPVEEEPEDTRPRDKNGKLLSQNQIEWGEMAHFAATSTSDAIRQRKNIDGKFREFIATNLRREMQEQPVGDAVTAAGQPTTKARVSQELTDFANKYNREPIANLRPKNGVVSLAGELIPWATFNDLLAKASAAGVIR